MYVKPISHSSPSVRFGLKPSLNTRQLSFLAKGLLVMSGILGVSSANDYYQSTEKRALHTSICKPVAAAITEHNAQQPLGSLRMAQKGCETLAANIDFGKRRSQLLLGFAALFVLPGGLIYRHTKKHPI